MVSSLTYTYKIEQSKVHAVILMLYLTPASLEITEEPERNPLFFNESGGTDLLKALGA